MCLLNTFLSVAEDLRVKGLTQNKQPFSETNTKKPKQAQKPPDPTPPPKRPRTVPSTADVLKRSKTTPSYSQDDNEIEEYTLVKTEPRDPLPHPIPVQSVPASFHSQDEFQTQDPEIVEEAGNDQGTVALDESYAVDEGYDYQNAGDSYKRLFPQGKMLLNIWKLIINNA